MHDPNFLIFKSLQMSEFGSVGQTCLVKREIYSPEDSFSSPWQVRLLADSFMRCGQEQDAEPL